MLMIEDKFRLYTEIIKYYLINFEYVLFDVKVSNKENFIRVKHVKPIRKVIVSQ